MSADESIYIRLAAIYAEMEHLDKNSNEYVLLASEAAELTSRSVSDEIEDDVMIADVTPLL